MRMAPLHLRALPDQDTMPWLALVNASPDAVIICSRQGEFLHLNGAATRLMTHIDPKPCWSHLLHTQDFPAFMQWLLQPSEALFRARLASRTTDVWEWSLGVVEDEDLLWLTGRQVVVASTAITSAPSSPWLPRRPKPAHDQVRRLCGHLAHLLNNMLVSTLGNLEIALLDTEPDDPRHEMLLDARISSGRAARLNAGDIRDDLRRYI